MKQKYDLIVYIGRFQPLHKGHIETLNQAKSMAVRVLVLVGSSNLARSPKNPFTFKERRKMIEDSDDKIRSAIDSYDANRYSEFTHLMVEPLSDYYEDNKWLQDVQSKVRGILLDYCPTSPEKAKVAIIGHKKDHTSYYLDHFPQWDFIQAEKYNNEILNATDMRSLIFENKLTYLESVFTTFTLNNIKNFMQTEEFSVLKEDYKYYKKYNPKDFDVTMTTVDAIVVQSGHVLLIRRKYSPGKGLYAIPGGFINQTETLQDAVIRELKEETGLKVPKPVLLGSIKDQQVFDNPSRSQRGRIITHAYYFQLKDDESLPKIRGGDDADKAEWFSFDEVQEMSNMLYEDHFSILNYFIN